MTNIHDNDGLDDNTEVYDISDDFTEIYHDQRVHAKKLLSIFLELYPYLPISDAFTDSQCPM